VQIGVAGRLSSGLDEREQRYESTGRHRQAVQRSSRGREVVVLYMRNTLCLRDLVEIMARRQLSLARTTIIGWVKRFTPAFFKRRDRFAKSTDRSWRADETYVEVCGKCVYVFYSAVDHAGKTVDFRLSITCDVVAAKTFFKIAIGNQGLVPDDSPQDDYPASHRAVREMKVHQLLPAETTFRSSICTAAVFANRNGKGMPLQYGSMTLPATPRRDHRVSHDDLHAYVRVRLDAQAREAHPTPYVTAPICHGTNSFWPYPWISLFDAWPDAVARIS